MKKEITATGKTVDEALASAKQTIGADVEGIEYEILELPKKGLLGIGSAPAVIKVTYTVPDPNPAKVFLESLLGTLGINADVTVSDGEEGEMCLDIEGEGTGMLIGHHGETLDALQYLTSLAHTRGADEENRKRRVTVDIGGYREKRAETLRTLARRMSARVLK